MTSAGHVEEESATRDFLGECK